MLDAGNARFFREADSRRQLEVKMVLRSMPDSFNPSTMAIESRSDANLTFYLVMTK